MNKLFYEKNFMMERIRILTLLSVLAIIVGLVTVWNLFTDKPENNPNSKQNKTTTTITYGRFLEYLNAGWIKKVDFYNNGKLVIVEASSPQLGDRIQKISVEIPVGASPLIVKLREAKIDFTAHPSINYELIFSILKVLLLPLLFIIGAFFIFTRYYQSMNLNMQQFLDFGKSPAKIQVNVQTGVSFQDVAGIDEAKEDFEEIVTFLKKPQQFTSVGAKIPKGVLLVGPPGTGKTLLAKAIAGESKVPFISISGSEFVEMFVGVGASRVRDLFKKAQEFSPCIIFIDEIDAIGRQRGAGVGGGNDEREQTLNQILTEMDGFKNNTGIIVIAATNRVDVLDSALLRPGRFDRQVNVNLPNIQGRIEILKVHAANKKLDLSLSLEKIAERTPGFSGADLANLLNEAAILTARNNKIAITSTEINIAIDRVIAGLEGTTLKDTKNKRLIAYHELGHAITGTLLRSHDNVQKITLIPRGQAQGLTWFMPDSEEFLISRTQLVSRIVAMLGGRASEEVIFGITEITTGATNDLQQVTKLARKMVTQFGMSTLGPRALKQDSQPVFLGRGMAKRKVYSNETSNRIDIQIKNIVYYSYIKAISIIKDNRIILDRFVDNLILEEIIDGTQFRNEVQFYTNIPNKKKQLEKRGILV